MAGKQHLGFNYAVRHLQNKGKVLLRRIQGLASVTFDPIAHCHIVEEGMDDGEEWPINVKN